MRKQKSFFTKSLAIILLVILFATTMLFINPVGANQTYTSKSYAQLTISSGDSETTRSTSPSEDLQVYYINGAKTFCFIAFNFSDFPQGAIPVSATFKIKCQAISPASYVSAFARIGVDWVNKDLTWDTKPTDFGYLGANFVNTMNDWYSYSSDKLNNIVSAAAANRISVTIELKTGIQNNDESGIIIFYPDAVLEVSYTTNTNTPTPTTTISPSLTPQSLATPTSNPTSNSIQNVGSISLDSTNIAILSIVIGFVVILSVSIYRNRTAKKK